MSRSNRLTPKGNKSFSKSFAMTEDSFMSTKPSPEDDAELFTDLFDRENKGQITLIDLEATLVANGFMDEKAAILSLVQLLDTKSTGKVATRDIIRLFEPEFVEVEANAKHIFGHFDVDGKGKVDCDKLIEGASDLGVEMSDKQANAMIQPFDSNHDGAIDLKDFTAILS